MSSEARGMLLVVSAPSGAGKTTVVRRVVADTTGMQISRSYTSRAPRGEELDGVDYHFVTRDEFERLREAGAFLEWAEVFGELYGTRLSDTEAVLEQGRDLLLVIDVQGAEKIRARGLPLIGIFLVPPSFEVLEARLRARSEDTPERIRCRLDVARREMEAAVTYDYVVVNDDLEAAVAEVRAIVIAERARMARRRRLLAAMAEDFRRQLADGARQG